MKTALSLDALYVTELHVLFAYIQSDSESEKSNIIDHPPTLQWNPPTNDLKKKSNQLLCHSRCRIEFNIVTD